MKKELCLTVNGKEYMFGSDENPYIPDTETLRETLHNRIPGIDLKLSCNRGICGNCTVIMDGKPVNSCMILSAACQGADIVTFEGLSDNEKALYELFKADKYFTCHSAYIGIRGLVMICIAQIREKKNPTRDDFAEALRGNYGRYLDTEAILNLLDKYSLGVSIS